jgi:DNA polymerase
MRHGGDERTRIRDELLTWIRQNDTTGMDWYLDEGPVPTGTATPGEKPVAGPATPRPAAPATGDPEFDRYCARFVADTLELVDRGPGRPARAPIPDKKAALDALRGIVLPCTACELHRGRTNTVFGAGNPDAELVFIGEAPGRDEDLQGEPFVGPSGQLLTKILGAIGYGREDVFICNILKCRPPNNRDPLPAEVAACEPHLKEQLAILSPRVICCLGRVAAQTLLGTDASLKRLRETVQFYEGIPVLATYHPAALLRNPGWKRDTWNDVRKLRALVDALAAKEA